MLDDQLQRYTWLLDIIRSNGPISKEDIDRAWNESPFSSTQTGMPRESFNRYRRAIKKVFNIDICCNRSTRKYFISDNSSQSQNYQWLTSTLSLVRSVRDSADLAKRVEFESTPSGINYLPRIIEAMKKQTMLIISHQSYRRTEPHTFLLQPYGLKLFKHRWYLVGFSDEYGEVRTFSLDRVSQCANTNLKWQLPVDFDLHEYYKPYFGILRTCQPEIIRIRAVPVAANYLRSLPLHYTQQEIEQNPDYTVFQYNVAPTFEFIQELRSYGAELCVLSPQWLVDKIRHDIEDTLAQYQL